MDDSLTIVLPTAGRLSLRDTLRSYAHQMAPGDEVIVVGDCTDGPLPVTEQIVALFDARFRYVPVNAGFHSWGHAEINAGMKLARGGWVLGNDDDDLATPNALADIRAAIAEQPYPRPLLFQFMCPWREVLWDRREIVESRIGGHCLVQPNDPDRMGFMALRYSGDYEWIASTVANYGGDVAWVPRVIAWTRPTPAELARLIPRMVMA